MSITQQVFSAALRDAEAFTYRSTVPFEIGRTVPPSKRAYKLGNIADVFIERDDLEERASKVFTTLKVGAVKRLISGTGTGKSTRIPVMLATQNNCIGIVLCPTHVLAQTIADYVTDAVAVGRYATCSVVHVSDYVSLKKVVKPAVVYMGVNEFLTILAARVDLFMQHVVGFVIVDEAHERIPAYSVIRLLISVDVFKTTRLLFATATASSQNMEMRTGGVTHTIKTVSAADLAYEDAHGLNADSPMHYSSINSRTLIFVPTESHFALLLEYYEANAVHVQLVYATATAKRLYNLNLYLADIAHAVVIIATPAHQTGFTFMVDVVIDCTVTSYLEISDKGDSIVKCDRLAAEFETTQRCGRVGRHLNGVAYHVDADLSSSQFELYQGSQVYVPLWCKVFNIKVSIDYINVWDGLMEQLSVDCAQILLCSRVHPCFIINYLDMNGQVYSGTRSVFKIIMGDTMRVKSSGKKLPDLAVEAWLVKQMRDQFPGVYEGDFRSPCEIPTEWLPIACVLYHGLIGNGITALMTDNTVQVKQDRDADDSKTVVSYALTASTVLSAARSDVSVSSASRMRNALQPDDSISVRGTGRAQLPLPSLPSYVTEAINTQRHHYGNNLLPVLPDDAELLPFERAEIVKVHRKKQSKDSGSSKSTKSRGHRKSSSSEVSDISASMTRVSVGKSSKAKIISTSHVVDSKKSGKIKVHNLGHVLIRPYDDELMRMFTTRRIDETQIRLYAKLSAVGVEIATMSASTRDEYFIAVILTWNRTISNMEQFSKAKFKGLFSDYRNRVQDDSYAEKLRIARSYLATFELHGYRICNLIGKEQLGRLCVTKSLLADINQATLSVAIGSQCIQDALEYAKICVNMVRYDAGMVGQYFVDGNKLFFIKHVFMVGFDGNDTLLFPRHDIKSMTLRGDKRLFKCKLSCNGESRMSYRLPKDGEAVYAVAYLEAMVPSVFGVFVVKQVKRSWTHTGVLSDGMSGAVLIALEDGAVIGFHNGYDIDASGQFNSEFVPMV